MEPKEIHNFVQISETIATAGQPTVEQFAAIKDAGYETIVNLALLDSTNAIANEREIVEAQDMAYIHIPVSWEAPALEDVDRFFEVLQQNGDRRIFVHCAKNMRVSAFVYLYRTIRQHVPEDEARQTMQRIWIPNKTWQALIQAVKQKYA